MYVSTKHPHAEVILPASQLADRRRWLRLRQTGITATDARVLAGFGYKDESIYSHWQEKFQKFGDDTAFPEDDLNIPMRWRLGSDLEPIISKYAAEELGCDVAKVGMLRSTELAFMISSPDRNCSCGGHVELKATDSLQLQRYTVDAGMPQNRRGYTLPAAWYWQGAHQLATSGRDHVHFAALIGRDDLTTWDVSYPQIDLERCKIKAEMLWEHVQDATPPPVDWDTVTEQEMKARHPEVKVAQRILLPDEVAAVEALIRQRQVLKLAGKDLDPALSRVENEIREWVSDAAELIDPNRLKPLVRYPEVAKQSIDWKAILADNPHIDMAKYTTLVSHRQFTSVAKLSI